MGSVFVSLSEFDLLSVIVNATEFAFAKLFEFASVSLSVFAKLLELELLSVFVRLFESVFGLLRSLVMEFGYGCRFLVGTALCLP